jgi:hypothetical protein
MLNGSMFRVDRPLNRIERLDRVSFSDLKFEERKHLQEWLAHQPDALGEDLLIIQKEFDGFDGTRERLDLLAMDETGQLVVIENKLDDSGRDVTWQALKYAAYVSSLTNAQIVEIFQKYLDANGGGDATAEICKFLDIDTLAGTVLNAGHDQRLIFIAANFRKEVTSTVLWLREHKIDARCIKVTPYRFGEEVFIDLQPVIPTREAAEFMISMAEKETEEKSAQVEQRKTEALRMDYWTKALAAMKAAHVGLYGNISPGENHWLQASSGFSGCSYGILHLKMGLRVELRIARPEGEDNKWIFDELIKRRDQIEAAIGHPVEWLRLDSKKESRIQFMHPCDGYDRDKWDEFTAWHVEYIQKWEKALKGPLQAVAVAFKARESAAVDPLQIGPSV